MFYFGLLDSSGLLKVKAFGEDAEKYYGIVEEGKFFSIEYARVSVAKNPNNIFPLKFEVIVYKAGCVVDVRKGELRKLELEVFDASMKPGETVLEWNFPFIFICFLFF
jgi:hypothetical protein